MNTLPLILAATPYCDWHSIVPVLVRAGLQLESSATTETWYQTEQSGDPSRRYLFIHTRPEVALAYALTKNIAPDEAFKQWQAAAQAMVSFFKRNRRHCVMVHLAYLQRQPEAMLAGICEHLNLKQSARTEKRGIQQQSEPPAVELLLATQWVHQAKGIDQLLAQLEACTLPLQGENFRAPSVDVAQVIELLKTQKRDAQRDSERAEAEQKLSVVSEEASLALDQLHLVQEELERQFSQKQKLQRQWDEYRRDQDKELIAAKQEIARLQNQLNKFQSSKAWKATAPVRALGKSFRRGGGLDKSLKRQWTLIKESGLFDQEWYLATYTDVAKAGMDPIEHYLKFGVKEGRNPNRDFNTQWYLNSYPDVAQESMNPLVHYIKFGQKEQRAINLNHYPTLPSPVGNK